MGVNLLFFNINLLQKVFKRMAAEFYPIITFTNKNFVPCKSLGMFLKFNGAAKIFHLKVIHKQSRRVIDRSQLRLKGRVFLIDGACYIEMQKL